MVRHFALILGLFLLNGCTKDSPVQLRASDDKVDSSTLASPLRTEDTEQRDGTVTLHINAVRGDTNRVLNSRGIIRAQSPALRRCYEEAISRSPQMRGQLDVDLVVSEGGLIESISAEQTGNLDGKLVDCVSQRLRIVRFDPPRAGRARITVPMLFGLPH